MKNWNVLTICLLLFGGSLIAIGCSSSGTTATTTTTAAAATTTTTTTAGATTTTAVGATTTTTTTSTTTTTAAFTLTSSAFTEGGAIPIDNAYQTVSGSNKSIPLAWINVPAGTQSFALSMRDLDSPGSGEYVHWLVVNIPSGVTSIAEDASALSSMPSGSVELITGNGLYTGYEGPWPIAPSSPTTHNYVITVYALNVSSVNDFNTSTEYSMETFTTTLSSYVIDTATLSGTYYHNH